MSKRPDAIGFFWQDIPPEKPPKAEKEKRTPPERTWESPDYLPGLEEALAFDVPLFGQEDLIRESVQKHGLLFDLEIYPNYFLAAFKSVQTGKVLCIEKFNEGPFNTGLFLWVLQNFTSIGFNSASFDMPIAAIAASGASNAQVKHAVNQLIVEEMRAQDVLKYHKVKKIRDVDHIDVIEVAPLSASLKIYNGRLHGRKMQDLPFPEGTVLSPEQAVIVRYYCVNDLDSTGLLCNCLVEQLQLRAQMTHEYGIDLRSKSDAQIAEAVIAHELERITGYRPQRPQIDIGTRYRYKIPSFLRYQTPLMNWVLGVVANTDFIVGESGAVGMPPELADMKIEIAGSVYRMGIGGLHSSEQKVSHVAGKTHALIDRDVASYYPFIILNQGLYPTHLGPAFLTVYRTIVDRRIAAKKSGNKVVADSLKIVINGSYGKLGSPYSILYAPDLLVQVTLTGQLALLMLIERLELAGVSVVSANTDGIVIKARLDQTSLVDSIAKQWEKDTSFETEETRYLGVYSRDVNSYIAVKSKFDKEKKVWTDKPDGTKTKGFFANPWADSKNPAFRLHKNPANQICVAAVENLLVHGTPIEETIRSCKDVTQFVSVRNVTGGAVKCWPHGNEYLGKSVRWYYATGEHGEMVYAKTGNRVSRSAGAKPMMTLTETIPDDLDWDWYIKEAENMLSLIGYDA
jgi:hypothetical protein